MYLVLFLGNNPTYKKMKITHLVLNVLFICLLFGLSACQNSGKTGAKTNNNTTAPKNTAVTQAAAKTNPDIKPLLERLLPKVEKVEYVFYKKGMSFSTETSGKNSILPYFNFISDQEMPDRSCTTFDGGAVFRAPEGDIVLTVDFIISDQKCKSFVVTAENKAYYQQMDKSGYEYLMRFYNIDMNQGTPTQK